MHQVPANDELIVRSRVTPWAVGTYLVLAGAAGWLAVATHDTRWRIFGVVTAAAFAAMAVVTRRTLLTCTPAGATARTLIRTRYVPWRLVERIETADWSIIGARLADGGWAPLLRHRGWGDPDTERVAGTVQSYLDRFQEQASSATDAPTQWPRPAAQRTLALSFGGVAVALAVLTQQWRALIFGIGYAVVFGWFNRRGRPAELKMQFRPAPRTPR